ncbi:MAG: hypothetical protein NTV31_06595 [Bacteroidia bacterium]|nr:hypothetical protein [Bacteroidia bacterium]
MKIYQDTQYNKGALPVGYLMITKPDGSGAGMTVDILSGSPFRDFFIPGLFLFTINGLFNLVSSILSFFKFRYASFLGFGLGIALIIWISVQVYSVGLTHFLQPTYFIIGIGETILSIYIYKTEKLNLTN